MADNLISKGIDYLKEYVNLSGKLNKQTANNILTAMFKQYINVDEVAISPMETSIDGFKFHIVEREELKFDSDMTDHYIDSNVAVQDHIAWKPAEVTLTLQQGEYFNMISENVGHSPMYYQAMSTINSLLPKTTTNTIARKIKSAISRATGGKGVINTIANKVTSISYGILLSAIKELNYQLFTAKLQDEDTSSQELKPLDMWRSKSKQVEAVVTMEALWRTGTPIKLVTSWKTFNDMVITSMRVSRDNNADVTEFTITLKELRTTKSLVVKKSDEKTGSGRNADQKSKVADLGTQRGQEVAYV